MKRVKPILVISFTSLAMFFIACDPDDLEVSKDQFLVGEFSDNYISTNFEPEQYFCNRGNEQSSIDLTADDVFDMAVYCDIQQSSGGLYVQESWVDIYNDSVEVLGVSYVDTIFKCLYYYLDDDKDTLWHYCLSNYESSKCFNLCDGNIKENISYTEDIKVATKFEFSDTIPDNAEWLTGRDIVLGYYDQTYVESSLNYIGNGYDVRRGGFAEETSSYIIFRIRGAEDNKCGWLSLNTLNDWSIMWSNGFAILDD